MKIDVWSDIRCPFCYIGKRKLELALDAFEFKEEVELEWHSYELDPYLKSEPGKNIYDYLAERKGISKVQSEQLHAQVTQTAAEVGLEYNFDKAVIANSFDAHRLIQFAKTKKLDDACEEALFHAYFTEGKDISDKTVLLEIGVNLGFVADEITSVLDSDAFAEEVNTDEETAHRIGVGGVPFFVFNNKYAISGAQAPETFLSALKQCKSEEVTVGANA